MTFRIALRSRPSPHFHETHKRWQVLPNGKPWGDPFYYNMRGFRGVLPLPGGGALDPGEITLKALRKEVARLNRDARENEAAAP